MLVFLIIWTPITLPLLFQFAKRNEKVMPPLYVLNFRSNPPSLLLSFSPMPPSNFPPPPGNYCTVPIIITQYPYPYTKCSCRVMKRISNNHIICFFSNDFCRHSTSKTWNIWPNFFKFQSIFIFSNRWLGRISSPKHTVKFRK